MSHTKTLSRPRIHIPPPPPAPTPAREGFDWAAGGWAGVIAGAAFLLIETTLITMFGSVTQTDAIRQIAAISLGESVLPTSTFTALVFMAAMAVHLPLSLLYARIVAAFVHGRSIPHAIGIGAVFGVALYFINYHAFTHLFPWFALARGWVTLTSHIAFGVLAAGTYAQLTYPLIAARRHGRI
jgi:hypothetical protein